MGDYIGLIISCIFVNNILLMQYLGNCPFLGVSKKMETAVGMTGGVIFVLVMAGAATWLVEYVLLKPFDVQYLRTLAFILVIATLVQFVEMYLKKSIPTLYAGLGIYLPLITTNCAVLGVCFININEGYNLLETVVNGFGGGLGFTMAILIMASIRERLEFSDIPECMKGFPIAFVLTSMMAFAFFGFQGFFSK